jgi:hypothetical protein
MASGGALSNRPGDQYARRVEGEPGLRTARGDLSFWHSQVRSDAALDELESITAHAAPVHAVTV